MAPGESKDERDERVAKLWQSLGVRKDGRLDLNGLKKGLKKIDHQFRTFVDQTEQGLWQLFQTIDRNHNGEIDKNELKAAFSNADVTVSSAKLDAFFADVDTNSDGVITYPEWRDFLLFLPAYSNLRAVLSYYTATGNLNPEGDVHINDLQGLGTDHSFPKRYILAIKNLLYNILPVHALAALIPSAYAEVGGALNFGVALENDSVSLDGDSELEWLPVPRTVAMWMSFRYYERKLTENTPQLGYFIAGGIAGAVSRTATAPLDRLKVYLIAQTGAKSAAVCAAKDGAPLRAAGNASKSLADAVKELWRAGGIRSLFAGNGLNVLKVMPESAIKFGAYESAKRAFARLEGHNDPRQLAPTSQFLSGGCGGMVAQYLMDLDSRMQCETVEGGLKGNKLIAATARKVLNKHGILGFFRGLPLGLVGMFPYAAIDLTTFEYLKRGLLARKARLHHCHEDDVPLNNFTTGAIGAISGGFSASVVYPLNVLRTRLQAQGTILHPATYSSIGDVARKTIQTEGLRGLYKGITPNLMKVAPAVSISYVVYENSKRMLGLR
ncbi:mitochondrial carrier domain-containing protein [Aspergillus pseudocaelatus]|uniref:Mitochondrial thiamine pyrophosphate carrier 1 n=1 Tax=Aspergillus pseudocaelatus TaxID=1825620 RepID=A0ABQ6WYB8_9EURO|nr:mitochondrial carrier domain-containing protein [Aspergillus pseudocaelatus]